MNYSKALNIPLSEGNMVKVIIGAVLNLIPIVNFLCLGFFLDMMSNGIRDREAMPEWENWGDKFVKGIIVFVISLIYGLIPLILFTIGGGVSVLSGGFSGIIILAFLISLVIWFVMPMALAHYAATGNFGAAFSLGTILGNISAVLGGYICIYLFSIGLGIILSILSVIPLIGWLLVVLGGFYTGCVIAYLFGNAYRLARASGTGSSPGF